jgi:hypothetical protein
MAETSYPFEGVDTTEAQYTTLIRNLVTGGRSGVNSTTAGTELKVYGDSSGMSVKLPAGFAVVRGHGYNNSAELSLTVVTAESNPRIDTVVLELNPTANTIIAKIVKGTAAVTPSRPALTQTETGVFQFPIADVAVAASATTIAAGDVSDRRTFLIDSWTTATRPTAITGLFGWNTTTSRLEVYNGSAWVDVVPSSFDAAAIISGTFDVARLPTVTIAKGGTGSTDAASALTSLGAAAASHTHAATDVVSGTLSVDRLPTVTVAKGGTGGTSKATGRTGLGVYVQATAPTSGMSDGDLWFW